MIPIDELKDSVRKNVKWDTKRPPVTDGQQCGLPRYPVVLKSEDLDLEITIGYYRSSIKNKELANTLFELVLDELVK